MTRIYYREHRKKNYDISIWILFNTVATSLLPKLSPLIVIHGRPVYLFQPDDGRILLWFHFPQLIRGFALP